VSETLGVFQGVARRGIWAVPLAASGSRSRRMDASATVAEAALRAVHLHKRVRPVLVCIEQGPRLLGRRAGSDGVTTRG